jgi:hypothetical protein
MAKPKVDKELDQYRNLLATPSTFEDGFGWTTIAGILFCGLIMTPGAIYLGLMTGGNIASAATWVTVILFSEITRRALKTMTKGNLIILLHAAAVIMGYAAMGPAGTLVHRAYLVTSDAARDMGMRDFFPTWWCPKPDSPAITERSIFHPDWLKPILIMLVTTFVGLLNKYTVGYFFFRLCSDVERLPFPMAPISAQGSLALADSTKKPEELEKEENTLDEEGHKPLSKWRIFSLGALIGIAFGFIQVGVPAITGLFLDKPVFLIPQPYLDTTTMTETILPATPTGVIIDPGIIITGMVLPFWAIIGSFSAILVTLIANPILHASEVLVQWQPGMNTVNATFVNSIDFWMSFGFGTSAAIALISVYSTVRDVIKRGREAKKQAAAGTAAADAAQSERDKAVSSLWKTPSIGRGDWPIWICVVGYLLSSTILVTLCNALVPGILGFLIFFVVFYNPFISYVNARLLGLTGQHIDIPFIREGCFILSGYNKLDIWLAPVPLANYGAMAQSFRVNELTGVRFRSLIFTDLVAVPTAFLLSFFFWGFIWKANAIPSDIYPAAQLNWELGAKSTTLLYSATFHPESEASPESPESQKVKGQDFKDLKDLKDLNDSSDMSARPTGRADMSEAANRFADTEFAKALHPKVIATGATLTILLFTLFSVFGLPTLFIYGMIRGFGALPHGMVLEIVGAVLGRWYFQKKFGKKNFLRSAPALAAGYATGVGLIGMLTIAMNLIKNAVSSAPF